MPQAFWPNGIKAAVSLSFDDALDSQLNNALPLMNRRSIKGTFYVNPSRTTRWEEQVPKWQAAASTGHEIGNHTTRHPCSCNYGFSKDYCLEQLTLDDISTTIDEAESILDQLFPDQRGRRSFCYPCYQSYVGAGSTRQSYVPLVAERFSIARGGGERTNNPWIIDLSYTWAQDVSGFSGRQLIDYVEEAIDLHNWAILCMHGVGAEHLAVSTEALTEIVDYLAENRDTLWTDTVFEIGTYIKSSRQKDPGS